MARPADPHARAALVEAARKVFVARGIRGARIEDITAACGLSKGAFYLHFPSKEALFGELVGEFRERIDEVLLERKQQLTRFFSQGSLSARDVRTKSARYEQMVSLEAKADREVLGLLWDFRDVFGVLVSGSQGTEFSNVIWLIAQREIDRVKGDFEAVKSWGACRDDVPSELFGSMMIGTYLLIAQQMSRLKKRPDLDVWVDGLHRLVREGIAPRQVVRGKLKVRRPLAARMGFKELS
jgi:AcrR family transcriptional regulator